MTLKDELNNIQEIDFRFDSDLTNYSTFRLRSRGDIAIVKSEQSLEKLLKVLKKNNRSWRMIGWGANQVSMLLKMTFLSRSTSQLMPAFFKN